MRMFYSSSESFQVFDYILGCGVDVQSFNHEYWGYSTDGVHCNLIIPIGFSEFLYPLARLFFQADS